MIAHVWSVKTNNTLFDDAFDRVFPRPVADPEIVPGDDYEEEKIKEKGCYL